MKVFLCVFGNKYTQTKYEGNKKMARRKIKKFQIGFKLVVYIAYCCFIFSECVDFFYLFFVYQENILLLI